jgi:hypothetical protein
LRSYGLIKDYYFWMEISTRIIDYYLKGCIEGQKSLFQEGILIFLNPRRPQRQFEAFTYKCSLGDNY